MTKKEFLSELQKRLLSLPTDEVADMMNDYSQYIDDKIADGASEEEAVSGFGNLDDLAVEILDACRTKPHTSESRKENTADGFMESIRKFCSDALNAIQDFYRDYLSQLSLSEIFRLLFIFILAISLIRLPLWIIEAVLEALINIATLGLLGTIVSWICEVIFQILYLLSIVVISISFYRSLTSGQYVNFGDLFKSPYRYFKGKTPYNDDDTNETIDMVNSTINTTVTTASQAIEVLIARAKARTEERTEKEMKE